MILSKENWTRLLYDVIFIERTLINYRGLADRKYLDEAIRDAKELIQLGKNKDEMHNMSN